MKLWFMNLSLGKKQVLTLLLAGLLPMSVVAVIALQVAKREVQTQALDQLEAVRDIKAQAVQSYFETVQQQILTVAAQRSTIDAMREFSQSFDRLLTEQRGRDLQGERRSLEAYYRNEFGQKYQRENDGANIDTDTLIAGLNEQAKLLQYLYISSSDFALGNKHQLNAAPGKASYHRVHQRYHPGIRRFLEAFGYYDIFLVDVDSGDIVYSVFKELDFASSLREGPYRDTNFAEAFTAAASMNAGEFALVDFASYSPSYEAPASFIASPIVSRGETIGVLVFQMPLEPINAIMSQRSGMGETGESYLVGRDHLMRSDSYLAPQTHSVVSSFRHPESGQVKTEASLAALSGQSSSAIIIDYNGNPVLSAYAPLSLAGFDWAVLAEIDVAEALAGVSALRNTVLVLVLVVSISIAAFAFYISRLLSRPILQLAELIQRVQREGDFSLSVNNQARDEVGQTSRAFNKLLKNLSSAIRSTNFVLNELGKGNFSERVDEALPGELGELGRGVNAANNAVKLADIAQQQQAALAASKTEEAEQAALAAKQQARETLIIKQALDVSATAVMIADEQFTIIYCNSSLDSMMGEREAEIQQSLPQFHADRLMGASIDQFHAEPQHQRRLLSSLSQSYQTEIKLNHLTFALAATPIRGHGGEYLGAVIEWQDLTASLEKEEQEKVLAEKNARIRQALDCSSTSTMIADEDFNIIYTNESLQTMMANAESDLREHLGHFDASNLVGCNMDMFHRDASHQRALLSGLKQSYNNQVSAGRRHFSLTANPIVSADNKRIGTVVEWLDRTEEVAVEAEIDTLIDAAAKGDFSRSLNTDNKNGFFLRISNGLNRLLSTTNIALEDIMRVLSALAQGDLSKKIERGYDGEFAQLKLDANSTVEKLRQIISEISSGTANIARSSSEISSGTNDLSQRTEEQASSLEETASSMEQITRMVQNSADSAESANQAAQTSVQIARQGNDSVQKTVAAMHGISEASAKIANIIGVIDEIAFQTNLLALNAAVEAARAGEQGRGFAVVASEVRNLAQRSASAAKEIKELINNSVERVEQGSALVEGSGTTLANIVSEIERVGAMMTQILDSANEQVAGIQQVGAAISQMDQITQQNAALVEQASSSSENMADEAHRLDKLVSFFRA
ncbi:methyl-accepting chemotaxis protein [Agaribacterium haliotis]|uniref:methyl-accepting chemotaxis protein n=1 Tax=Agaribacterium haliotis TaxID=2013869 RepID=UPI000BB52BE8|nr:methyl-accepting chemotaxis protein [Agaribacterium haliotis]